MLQLATGRQGRRIRYTRAGACQDKTTRRAPPPSDTPGWMFRLGTIEHFLHYLVDTRLAHSR